MSNLQQSSRSDLELLPSPTIDLVADTAMLPPPDLRVPALAPPSLPSLDGGPVVPPMPRLTLDESDEMFTAPQPVAADHRAASGDVNLDDVFGTASVESGLLVDAAIDDPPSGAFELTVPAGAPPPPPPSPEPPDLFGSGPSPTVEMPAVSSDMLSAANQPLGAPPQVAMVVPSLPTVGAAAPSPAAAAAPPSHHPSQVGIAPMASLADALASPTPPVKKAAAGALGRSVARTLTAVVLAAVVGVGAHVGYDWWQNRDATPVAGVNVDGTDLASWPQVDPPAIRYTDSVTVFSSDTGTRTLTAHREIASGMTQARVLATDAEGAAVSQVELDIRNEQSYVQPAPDAAWALTSRDDAVTLLGDTWTTDVFTVRELFPAEAMPYITVLESVERLLPVRPLQPAVGLGVESAVPMAISTEPTSMVWQYRVIIDIDAFRANETIVFQEWQRRIGRSAAARMEAWVDDTGIVRQVVVEIDGTKVTHTLVGGAAASSRFDVNPLLAADPTTPVDAQPTDVEVSE